MPFFHFFIVFSQRKNAARVIREIGKLQLKLFFFILILFCKSSRSWVDMKPQAKHKHKYTKLKNIEFIIHLSLYIVFFANVFLHDKIAYDDKNDDEVHGRTIFYHLFPFLQRIEIRKVVIIKFLTSLEIFFEKLYFLNVNSRVHLR